jgi:endonuclease-3
VGDVYKKPAVVADTHVIRITNLLGLTSSKDPKKVEFDLKKYYRLKKAMISAIV